MQEAEKQISQYYKDIDTINEKIIQTAKDAIISSNDSVRLKDAIRLVNRTVKDYRLVFTTQGLIMLEIRPRGIQEDFSINMHGFLDLFPAIPQQLYNPVQGGECGLRQEICVLLDLLRVLRLILGPAIDLRHRSFGHLVCLMNPKRRTLETASTVCLVRRKVLDTQRD